ncbi:MAG: hypothetical protein NC043_07780 [Muribaculaceae bacterium]|nr:hypothetical protein [Muribaculaceae bacterium]
MITLSFSIDSIVQMVIARGALRHILHADRPAMLTADHTDVITCLAVRGFGMLCLAMGPLALRADDSPSASGLITLDLDVPSGPVPGLFAAMEESIVTYVLMCSYEGSGSAFYQQLKADYDSVTSRCRTLCGLTSRPAIRPCWL